MNIDFMIKFHRDKLTECDRCGRLELHMEKLLSIYRKRELVNICSKCSCKTNSFKKASKPMTAKVKQAFYVYLTSGKRQQEKLTAMMNAGYY